MQLPPGILGSNPAAVSIEMWITTASSGNNDGWLRLFQFGSHSVFCSGASCNAGSVYFGRCADNNGFRLDSWDLQGTSVASSGDTITTTFSGQTDMHVVVILYNGAGAKVYLNGALSVVTGPVYIPNGSPGEMNFIGFTSDLSNLGFVGSIDEVRFWSGALSQSQVSSNYVLGPNAFYSVQIPTPLPSPRPSVPYQAVSEAVLWKGGVDLVTTRESDGSVTISGNAGSCNGGRGMSYFISTSSSLPFSLPVCLS